MFTHQIIFGVNIEIFLHLRVETFFGEKQHFVTRRKVCSTFSFSDGEWADPKSGTRSEEFLSGHLRRVTSVSWRRNGESRKDPGRSVRVFVSVSGPRLRPSENLSDTELASPAVQEPGTDFQWSPEPSRCSQHRPGLGSFTLCLRSCGDSWGPTLASSSNLNDTGRPRHPLSSSWWC